MIRNTYTQYGSVAKTLHWLIFILIVAMLIMGFFYDDISDKATKYEVLNIHKITGICILALMILRLIWALMNPKPRLPFGIPNWHRITAHGVHYLLYVLLIIMPITGWIMSVAAGKLPHFFSLQFPLPIPESKAISDTFFTLHNGLAWTIIAVVSLHILAAFYHYFVKKDDVLQRMI